MGILNVKETVRVYEVYTDMAATISLVSLTKALLIPSQYMCSRSMLVRCERKTLQTSEGRGSSRKVPSHNAPKTSTRRARRDNWATISSM